MTFKDQHLNSMIFQAWKMKFSHSMTFQFFHDVYKPCAIYSLGGEQNS